jgi:hypothetical protein
MTRLKETFLRCRRQSRSVLLVIRWKCGVGCTYLLCSALDPSDSWQRVRASMGIWWIFVQENCSAWSGYAMGSLMSRFVADQNRPSPGNRLEVVTFSVLILIIPWWIEYSIPLVGSNLIFPFSCWPVFLDRHSKLSRRLRGSLSIFISHYPCFAVSPFSCSILLDLSVDLWAYSRGYVSLLILFPRIGDRSSIPIFALASLSAFFCISCISVLPNRHQFQHLLFRKWHLRRFYLLPQLQRHLCRHKLSDETIWKTTTLTLRRRPRLRKENLEHRMRQLA